MDQEYSSAEIAGMLWDFAPPLVLETALNIGLFEVLDRRALGVAELSQDLGVSVRGLRALSDVLTALGFIQKGSDGEYSLTDVSKRLFIRNRPGYLGDIFAGLSDKIRIWLDLTEAIRTGAAPGALDFEVWGSARYQKSVPSLFSLNYPATQVLARKLKLSGVGPPIRVLDLAAGSGVWGIGLAKASPRVKVTSVDWESVLPITRRTAQASGVADRFEFIAGDVRHASLGEGFQIVILGHILHSLGPIESAALLRRLFSVLESSGTVVIAEFLVNSKRTAPLANVLFALSMVLNTETGEVFSYDEVEGWLLDAGFTKPYAIPMPGTAVVVLATRP